MPWYAAKLMGPWNDPDGDVLIVLSSEMQHDNTIGAVSYWAYRLRDTSVSSGPFSHCGV